MRCSSIRIVRFVLLFLSLAVLSLTMTGCGGWGGNGPGGGGGGGCGFTPNWQRTNQTMNQEIEKEVKEQALKIFPGTEGKEKG